MAQVRYWVPKVQCLRYNFRRPHIGIPREVGLGVGECQFIGDHRVKTVQLTSSDHPKIRNFIKAWNFSLTDQPMASLGALRRPDEEEYFISSQTRGNYFFSEWGSCSTCVLSVAGLASLLKGPRKCPLLSCYQHTSFFGLQLRPESETLPIPAQSPTVASKLVFSYDTSKQASAFAWILRSCQNSVHTTVNHSLPPLHLLISAAARSHFRTKIVAIPLPPVYLWSQGQAHHIPLITSKSCAILSNPSTPPLSSNYHLYMTAPQGGV